MKKIRDLLADCRIELRSLVRDFHKTELCRRIDEARAELAGEEDGTKAVTESDPTAASASVDRVAMAWRIAAEDLRITAPAIYQLLAKKAQQHLAAHPDETPAAPTSSAPKPDQGSDQASPSASTVDPSATTPSSDTPSTAVVEASATPEDVPQSAPPAPPADPSTPSREDLLAISKHKRRFTEAQREWCVGEALIRSGFTIQPNDFIASGDHAMALYLLETETPQS